LPEGGISISTPVKRAIVTGASGFIGRALLARLDARSARVRGLDLPGRTAGERTRPADLSSASSAAAEVLSAARDLDGETVVFHLAGFANASVCRADPPGAFAANVAATANVLEACRAAGISRVLFPSTALVYALPARLPIDEHAPLGPRSIYAASKIAAEAVLAGYAADFGFSIDVARLGNVYGPGGPADSVAPTLLRQVLGDGRVHLRTLAPIRDFIHCDDVAQGLIRLAEAGSEPGLRIFNLASGVPTSIAELAELAAGAVGNALPAIETEPGTRRDDQIALDVGRLRARTGWTPSIPLFDGLVQTLKSIRGERE
jgi:nucleoside-diphosphate-sugar epimerase